MIEFISFIFVAFAVLQIILFFKLWNMTKDVADIKSLLNARDNRNVAYPRFVRRKADGKRLQVKEMINGNYHCIWPNSDPESEAGFYSAGEVIESE